MASILFLVVIVVVAVLITVDVVRTPTETPAGPGDRHLHDPERAVTGARAATGVHAFPREPAGRDRPVAAAAAAPRFGPVGAGPADVPSFDRPDDSARAFDQMQREMSQSAASEAALRGKFNAMYVNLSRRSQALVERQLRLIEGLEHGEQDAQRLVGLSKLNRIAMRMHRNSQNLLVLVGQEPTTGWNQPVTLAHLVEAALSEIEEYERVAFEVQPDIALRGPAVHDAVHLLVELIDNATAFSAAEMPVHITGRILSSGGALIDITDRGIGMAAKEIAYANQQLDNPPAPDIDVPKWMGLLVVARLAARHGIRVRLNPAEFGGLTALVWFPDEILTHSSAAADPGYLAEQRGAAVNPAAFATARMSAPEPPATQPAPAWSARGPQPAVQPEPAALRLSGPVPVGDATVVVPRAEIQARTQNLPIFDQVESRWSRTGHEAVGPPVRPPAPGLTAPAPGLTAPAPGLTAPAPGLTAAAGPAAFAPSASGPSTSGLPTRRPAGGTQGPRTAPGAPNRPGGPRFQRGASPGWPAPADEATPNGPDES